MAQTHALTQNRLPKVRQIPDWQVWDKRPTDPGRGWTTLDERVWLPPDIGGHRRRGPIHATMEATAATEWVSVAEAAVRLACDPKTIQRRVKTGHRKHLPSRQGLRGLEVEVPARASTAEVANALTIHAEREIQLAGTLVASVERERRTMKTVAVSSVLTAAAAVAGLAVLWNLHIQQVAALTVARAEITAAKIEASTERERAIASRADVAEAEESARYWRTVAEEEREYRTIAGQSFVMLPPELLAAE